MSDGAPPGRFVELARPFNMRDLGGYTTTTGSSVAWRRLFRGGRLHLLGEGEFAALGALGIHTAIDLRTIDELQEHGAYQRRAGGRVIHLPLVVEMREIAALWSGDLSAPGTSVEELFASRYMSMAELGGDSIAAALKLLADPGSYPVVVFCAAGKDRTGILISLILGLLGVEDRQIAEDYALSAVPVLEMERAAAGHELTPPGMEEASVPLALSAPRGGIVGFLAEVRKRHGSLDAYAASLGVSEATLREIRLRLLVSPASN